MELKPLMLFVHVLGVVVWVGGMFFAYVCLRPVAAAQLPPPQRLPLWRGVFDLFLNWVWVAVGLILASGLAMMLQAGFKGAPVFWHVMFVFGLAMMLIFAHVYFAPYKRLCRACEAHSTSVVSRGRVPRFPGRSRRLLGAGEAGAAICRTHGQVAILPRVQLLPQKTPRIVVSAPNPSGSTWRPKRDEPNTLPAILLPEVGE